MGEKAAYAYLSQKNEYWFIYDTRQAHPPAA